MNIWSRLITRETAGPSVLLVSAEPVWHGLVNALNERSGGRRESGAFLLGRIGEDGVRTILDYLLYDDLDPEALDTGAIHLRSSAYGALWQLCSERNLKVVADVHTHPGRIVEQSTVDKRHPMISVAGHIAMILPNYGKSPTDPAVAGIYRYLGSYQWETLQSGRTKAHVIHVGK